MAAQRQDSIIRATELLRAGAVAKAAGDRRKAHELLRRAASLAPYNEQVWLALLDVLDDPRDRRVCLQNIVAINPYNLHAHTELAALDPPTGYDTAPLAGQREAGQYDTAPIAPEDVLTWEGDTAAHRVEEITQPTQPRRAGDSPTLHPAELPSLQQTAPAYYPPFMPNPPQPARRLRIGYLLRVAVEILILGVLIATIILFVMTYVQMRV